MKTSLSFLVFIGLALSSNSQVCTGDFVFENQQMVDDFLLNNPTCTIIDGNVYLGVTDNSEEITNLDGFQNITEITGDFQIEAIGPSNLSLLGLSNLTSIGGMLLIQDNANPNGPGFIPFLTGLENLVAVHDLYLTLNGETDLSPLYGISDISTININGINTEYYNLVNLFPNITTLDSFVFNSISNTIEFSGFDGLVEAGEILFPYNDDNLFFTSFDAFHNLESCDVLTFDICIAFGDVSGFENLQTVGSMHMDLLTEGAFFDFNALQSANNIWLISAANDPPDFNSLTEVTEEFSLTDTPASFTLPVLEKTGTMTIVSYGFPTWLETIEFPALDSIAFDFSLVGTNVSNLNFLGNLEYLGGQLILEDNSLLSDCAIAVVCDKLALAPEDVLLYDNAAGCNTTDEIISMCTTSYVTGSVFADLDCDGVYNNNDVYLPYSIIHNQDGNPVGSTYNGGNYFVGLADNSTTTLNVSTSVGFYPSPEFTFTTTTLDDVYTNADFALCPDPTAHNFSVFAYSNFSPTPGFGVTYYIVVENLGPNIDDAEVHFDLSAMPGATVSNSNGGVLSGTTVTWSVSDLSMFETSIIYLSINVDPSVALGTIYQPAVSVDIIPGTISDNDLYDNLFTFTQTVVGSYDPNDKSVNIPAVDIETLSSEDVVTLDYTIRFQNTGTAEAIFVRVEDVIEDDLDLTTFQMLNASHPFQLTFDEDRRVEWLFENIMLPDSTTDEAGSHGYIHFRINTKNNLQLTDTISNSCAIYFDYNAPVITNTATTIFYECPEELAITTEGNYCEGESIVLLATYGWDAYSWTVNDEPNGTGLGITIDNATPGIYFITCETTTEYCDGTAGIEFFVEETPDDVVITGDQDICEGENIVLTASSAWDNYSWIQNGNEISNTSSVEIESPSTGNYVMQLLTTNVNCSSTMDVAFTVFANPDVTIDFTNDLLTGPEDYDYSWYFWGQLLEEETSYVLDPWMYAMEGFSIYAVVTDGNGCIDTTNTIYISAVDERLDSHIEVYPNPMSESTFVKLPDGNFEIELFNPIGQCLKVWSNVQSGHVLYREQLTAGIYLLKATSVTGTVYTTELNVR